MEQRSFIDSPLPKRTTGGLTSLERIKYQYLYALQLMVDYFSEDPKTKYDGFACEGYEDFLLLSNQPEQMRILLVQVKTDQNTCVLRNKAVIEEVLSGFRKSTDFIKNCPDVKGRPNVEIQYRLVYNPLHDCTAHNCAQRVTRLPLYNDVAGPINFSPFLPLPLRDEALLDLLKPLEATHTAFLKDLQTQGMFEAFIQNIFGLIEPFFVRTSQPGRSLTVSSGNPGITLRELFHDKITYIDKLRTALIAAADRAHRVAYNTALHQQLSDAWTSAAQILKTGVSRKPIDDGWETVVLPNHQTALRVLAVISVLSNEGDQLLFNQSGPRRDEARIVIQGDTLVLAMPKRKGLETLRLLQCRPEFQHRQRVLLLLSFARAITAWARRGVVLTDFRAETSYGHLYFSRMTDGHPHFVLGDVGALALAGDGERMWDAEWIDSRVLAKAVRYLYYGTSIERKLQMSHLYGATWNDNVVQDLANWIMRRTAVRGDDFVNMLEDLFEDEIANWPLLFSEMDQGFVRDVFDSETRQSETRSSVTEVIQEARPTYLLQDYGGRHENLFYAFWNTGNNQAQVAFQRHTPRTLSLCRYIPYHTRRWKDTKERDVATAMLLTPNGNLRPVFVGVSDEGEASIVLSQVFGIADNKYAPRLHSLLAQAQRRRSAGRLPPILNLEEALLTKRRMTLDMLRRQDFKFESNPDLNTDPTQQVTLLLKVESLLDEHLDICGYPREPMKYRAALTVQICDDEACPQHSGQFQDLRVNKDKQCRLILIPMKSPQDIRLPENGFVYFNDKGQDAVIGPEQTLFRELRFGLSEGLQLPVTRAWDRLKAIFTEALPGNYLNHTTLWNGDLLPLPKLVGPTSARKIAGILLNRVIMSSRPPLECWHALTGAAGTGKTRVTANLVLQYLHATAKRSFPPRRVLVISASHFAIDNFLRVYREEGGQKYVPCRFITKHVRARLEGAEKLGDKVIDKDIYDWSHEHYKRIAADLPQYRTVQESHDWLGAYHSRLNSQLLELRAKRDDENGKKRFAFFPSHERWRSKHAPEKSWNHVREVSTGLKYFQDKLDQLLHIVKGNGDTFVEKGAHSNEEIEDPIELYKLFAAEVVATTVDAFDRLPDMRFDLVIFEEASQFAVIKFLKALTKIMRTRDEQGGDSPWIILSGDPQQLPPFFNGALCPSVPQ